MLNSKSVICYLSVPSFSMHIFQFTDLIMVKITGEFTYLVLHFMLYFLISKQADFTVHFLKIGIIQICKLGMGKILYRGLWLL
jgi:hypothetical protein